MDFIRITKVDGMRLVRRSPGGIDEFVGSLHLTTHHLIFIADGLELWIGYPMIHSAMLERPPRLPKRDDAWPETSPELSQWALDGSITIRCHHFLFITLRCDSVRKLYDVFATIKHLSTIASIEQLYAFDYQQKKAAAPFVYNPREEFARMGVTASTMWRFTDCNQKYQLCPTYPPVLVVPARISDTTLMHAAKYRSKRRLPVLCYLHPNQASMTRSSQPMVGLKQARSVQDEKLIEAILATNTTLDKNIIIDARPTTNAVVNRAVGAGSENMDHYRRWRKVYLGIDNIHVMRDALNTMVEAIETGDGHIVGRIQGSRTNWLRHIENIMVGVKTITEAISLGHHVLVHCSDGWDRTAQLTSLAQLCLDPFYRTIRGFAVLVEKEWVSFGHQFTLRCGHLGHLDKFKVRRAAARPEDESSSEASDPADSSGFDLLQSGTMFGRFASRALRNVQSRITQAIQDDTMDPFSEYAELQPNYVSGLSRTKHDHETSPVFQQFLDCVYQLWVQHPTMFEFNERFLLDLFYHLHAAQFGTFVGNNMRERTELKLEERTYSVWSWILLGDYQNELYQEERDVIVPDTGFIQYWAALFTCHDPAFDKDGDGAANGDPTEADAAMGPKLDSSLDLNSNVWAS
ncbi:phosphatidylinositol-3-phosphatase ymr1 [Coemansia spiralis]|uniref:Phosphatidylinositol-3-phosphatase ymr1 n=2 Tax=Coemansia TaxID=4863 RepID=A0A9W8KUK0_9FUNG|nr:phosphatidylinositol-3-phosphatase ymr1 [Coemansia umbellata]KAJ2671276.1 phosphatidylinositol-3-phosphatase ymr1 [Coemansia spiralis]